MTWWLSLMQYIHSILILYCTVLDNRESFSEIMQSVVLILFCFPLPASLSSSISIRPAWAGMVERAISSLTYRTFTDDVCRFNFPLLCTTPYLRYSVRQLWHSWASLCVCICIQHHIQIKQLYKKKSIIRPAQLHLQCIPAPCRSLY